MNRLQCGDTVLGELTIFGQPLQRHGPLFSLPFSFVSGPGMGEGNGRQKGTKSNWGKANLCESMANL